MFIEEKKEGMLVNLDRVQIIRKREFLEKKDHVNYTAYYLEVSFTNKGNIHILYDSPEERDKIYTEILKYSQMGYMPENHQEKLVT